MCPLMECFLHCMLRCNNLSCHAILDINLEFHEDLLLLKTALESQVGSYSSFMCISHLQLPNTTSMLHTLLDVLTAIINNHQCF